MSAAEARRYYPPEAEDQRIERYHKSHEKRPSRDARIEKLRREVDRLMTKLDAPELSDAEKAETIGFIRSGHDKIKLLAEAFIQDSAELTLSPEAKKILDKQIEEVQKVLADIEAQESYLKQLEPEDTAIDIKPALLRIKTPVIETPEPTVQLAETDDIRPQPAGRQSSRKKSTPLPIGRADTISLPSPILVDEPGERTRTAARPLSADLSEDISFKLFVHDFVNRPYEKVEKSLAKMQLNEIEAACKILSESEKNDGARVKKIRKEAGGEIALNNLDIFDTRRVDTGMLVDRREKFGRLAELARKIEARTKLITDYGIDPEQVALMRIKDFSAVITKLTPPALSHLDRWMSLELRDPHSSLGSRPREPFDEKFLMLAKIFSDLRTQQNAALEQKKGAPASAPQIKRQGSKKTEGAVPHKNSPSISSNKPMVEASSLPSKAKKGQSKSAVPPPLPRAADTENDEIEEMSDDDIISFNAEQSGPPPLPIETVIDDSKLQKTTLRDASPSQREKGRHDAAVELAPPRVKISKATVSEPIRADMLLAELGEHITGRYAGIIKEGSIEPELSKELLASGRKLFDKDTSRMIAWIREGLQNVEAAGSPIVERVMKKVLQEAMKEAKRPAPREGTNSETGVNRGKILSDLEAQYPFTGQTNYFQKVFKLYDLPPHIQRAKEVVKEFFLGKRAEGYRMLTKLNDELSSSRPEGFARFTKIFFPDKQRQKKLEEYYQLLQALQQADELAKKM